jgi:hypothetical protein
MHFCVITFICSSLLLGGSVCFGNQHTSDPMQLKLNRNSVNPEQYTLSWPSKSSHVYFLQQSDNLIDWTWGSFNLAEEDKVEEQSIYTDKSLAFFRLQYTEFSNTNSSLLLSGDFDGDLLSNYDEISTYLALGLDPLKSDSDGNGINDGLEDADSDSQNNAFEFAQGRLPTVADTDVSIYVDAILGNANYSGFSAVPAKPTAADGPKASITSALGAAADSDVVLLQSGAYDESVFSFENKTIILRPNGTVTVL